MRFEAFLNVLVPFEAANSMGAKSCAANSVQKFESVRPVNVPASLIASAIATAPSQSSANRTGLKPTVLTPSGSRSTTVPDGSNT